MTQNEPLVIERTANGFQVRPREGRDMPIFVADTMVFQDIGYASAARDYQRTEDTLLGFIAAHFTDPKAPAPAAVAAQPKE